MQKALNLKKKIISYYISLLPILKRGVIDCSVTFWFLYQFDNHRNKEIYCDTIYQCVFAMFTHNVSDESYMMAHSFDTIQILKKHVQLLRLYCPVNLTCIKLSHDKLYYNRSSKCKAELFISVKYIYSLLMKILNFYMNLF